VDIRKEIQRQSSMKGPSRVLRLLLPALVCAGLAGTARSESEDTMSSTVIGANPHLSDGAAAMTSGDWQRGIELTQLGIMATVSKDDRAAALANLCAGYAALKQFQKALDFCNQSLAILDDNWRTWQNRAACHLGLGKIEESLQDVQRGLQLNPDSDALQKTLAIARDYEKLQQERLQHLLES
jgi:tetratricopeptide (TPR) repeat protein